MGDYWKENGIEKPQQVVVCAACKDPHTDLLLVGARHWDKVMHLQLKHLKDPKPKAAYWVQGFINQFGEFLTRKEALIVAKDSGQLLKADGGHTDLFSEDLY